MREQSKDAETSVISAASEAKDSSDITYIPSLPLNYQFILPKCALPPSGELDPVADFVKGAIFDEVAKDETNIIPSKNYRLLLDSFRLKNDISMLRMILISLRICGNGEVLNLLASKPPCLARLTHLFVRLNPFNLVTDKIDEQIINLVDAQLHLFMALVTANSVFLVPVLTAIWGMLSTDQGSPEMTNRLHCALATAARLCPKTKAEIFPIISAKAPFRTKPEPLLKWYYSQTILVIRYIPTLESQVLELLVDKSLEMDVEIKIYDKGEAVIESGGDDAIFEMDIDAGMESAPKPEVTQQEVTVDEMADKLDTLLFLLFSHIEKAVDGNAVAASEKYAILEKIFSSSILVTHKSKFVQFLLLHLCGLEEKTSQQTRPGDGDDMLYSELYRSFAARLIDVVLDPHRATVTRQTSACYLASFTSRAAFVNGETCCEAVSALLRWAEAYMGIVKVIRTTDAREQCSEHSLFYTVCQAAFYIMCFRGSEVVDFFREATDPSATGSDFELAEIDIGPKRWESICLHPLQPLRYCLESVKNEFLEVATVYELIGQEHLPTLKDNEDSHTATKRIRKKVSKIATAATLEKERLEGGVGGLGEGTNPLDSFFPFDPFLLRRSHVYVEPFYKHWEGSIADILAENPDSDYDESDEEEEEEDADEKVDEESTNGDDDSRTFEPMSLGTPQAKIEQRRKIWTDTLKRPRGYSIASENGSW